MVRYNNSVCAKLVKQMLKLLSKMYKVVRFDLQRVCGEEGFRAWVGDGDNNVSDE